MTNDLAQKARDRRVIALERRSKARAQPPVAPEPGRTPIRVQRYRIHLHPANQNAGRGPAQLSPD